METKASFDNDLLSSLGRHQEKLVRDLLASPAPADAQRYGEAILKSIRHRLRNFLQSIAYMLSAQAQAETSPTAREGLLQAVSRIQIAMQLWESGFCPPEGDSLDLRELISMLISSLDPKREKEVGQTVAPLFLAPARGMIFAFVFTELVTNAFRYGRPPIRVRVTSEDGECLLCIEDEGPGLQEDSSLGEHSGCGLRIASNLVEAGLQGSFDLKKSEKGTAAWVRFPLLTGEKPSDTCRPENPGCGR